MKTRVKNSLLLVLAATLLHAAPSCRPEPGADAPNNFLIISIDALHPDAISAKNSPGIVSIMKKGTYTLRGTSVRPPKTLIAHAAMVTGLAPEQSGYTDNTWKPGEKRIGGETIFHRAREKGLRCGFFYSKEKLGFLANRWIMKYEFNEDYSADYALDFVKEGENNFVFLHVSGLEYAGMDHGWLSPKYLEELREIDRKLSPLVDDITKRGGFILIITSDHGGHGREHGTDHPDDYRVPFVFYSDCRPMDSIDEYKVTDLYGIVEKLL